MERESRLGNSEEAHKVEIDIRKILEQIGLDREKWPPEWRETAKKK